MKIKDLVKDKFVEFTGVFLSMESRSYSTEKGEGEIINITLTDNTYNKNENENENEEINAIKTVFFLNYSKYPNHEDIKKNFNELKQGDLVTVKGFTKLEEKFSEIRILQLGINVTTPVLQIIIKELYFTSKDELLNNDEVEDKERVEFQVPTKFGTQQSIVDIEELVYKSLDMYKRPSLVVSDNSSVHSFPHIEEIMRKRKEKMIYGAEMKVVHETLNPIINGTVDESDIKDKEFVFFDTETTGLEPIKHEFIELAGVKFKNGVITDKFQIFIKPKKEISSKITEITNITNEMVKNGVTELEGIKLFKEFVKDSILIGHNAFFDFDFIQSKMKKYNIDKNLSENVVIDTLKMSILLLNKINDLNVKSFKLDKMLKFFDIKIEGHHRALEDSKSTFMLFDKLMNGYKKVNKKNEEVIKGFLDNGYTNLMKIAEFGDTYNDLRFGKSVLVYAKNQKGLKSLYQLISIANNNESTDKFISFREIQKRRKNLVIISGGFNSKVFEDLIKDKLTLNTLKMYDYIGIHSSKQSELLEDISEKERELLNNIIIETVKKNKLKAIVLGNVHYIEKQDEKFQKVIINESKRNNLKSLNKKGNSWSYLKTVKELKEEFNYIEDEEVLNEIISTNTLELSNEFQEIEIVQKELAIPILKDADKKIIKIAEDKLFSLFGEKIPSSIRERIDYEIKRIVNDGYAVIYYATHLLVKGSLEADFLVGSRGSVGSSYFAYLLDITEVNPLPPHYYCNECKTVEFIKGVKSGFDLPTQKCNVCGTESFGNGHKISFDMFLGKEGSKKIPDIDLNFSDIYHSQTFKHATEIFGEGKVYRAGTIGTYSEGKIDKAVWDYHFKTGKKEILLLEEEYTNTTPFYYFDKNTQKMKKQNKVYSKNGIITVDVLKSQKIDNEKIDFIERTTFKLNSTDLLVYREKLNGVKYSTGQHAGGIMIIPYENDIHDFFPTQSSKDGKDKNLITTHMGYKSYQNTLLKMDNLIQDDPTRLHFLKKETGVNPLQIKFNDEKIINEFALGNTERISEFNTTFSTQVTIKTKPKNFSDLVKISGLTHGAGIWLKNGEELINNGKTIEEIIACREDLSDFLEEKKIEGLLANEITEKIRKGKGITNEEENSLVSDNIPRWYIDSMKKIKYLFPKAHATSYVMNAYRLMYFKVNYPLQFVKVMLDLQVDDTKVDFSQLLLEKDEFIEYMNDLNERLNDWSKPKTNKEKSSHADLKLVEWFYKKGFSILPIDLNNSNEDKFIYEGDMSIRLPLKVVTGLNKIDLEKILELRNEKEITLDILRDELKIKPSVISSLKRYMKVE